MTIKLDQLDNVGTVTDAAIKAGASRLNSVTFGSANSNNLQNQGIAAATKDAESKAQAQASALNLKLGPLLKSTTVPFSFPIPMQQAGTVSSARFTGVGSPSVSPGQITNSSDVTLTYATQ